MPDQITTAFIQQFKDGFTLVVQQLESLFRSRVRLEPIKGSLAYVDYIGVPNDPQAQTALIQKTNLQEIPHARRIIMGAPYPLAVPVSEEALSRLMEDPTASYVQALRGSFNRLLDRVTMAAAIGPALTASTDLLTQNTVNLPAAQIYTEDGTVGATYAKLVAALTQFNLNDVPEEAKRHCAISPQGIANLLLDPDITYTEELDLKAVQEGKIKQVAGFEMRMSNQLPKDYSAGKSGPGIRHCPCWVDMGMNNGICLGMNRDLSVSIAQRHDLNDLWQILVKIDFGATRMEEKLVYDMQIYEPL